jgi:hypothetical protein
MKREVIREDIEALAKDLCLLSGKGKTDKWEGWIPQAEEIANRIYGPLLESCQLAYRKHVLEDDSIGWESLGSQLCNALVETLGEEKYNEWLDSLETVK